VTLTPLEAEALVRSLQVSFAAVAVSLPAGIATGWLLARRDFPGKSVVDGLVHLPLVLPPVVVGYLLLVGFGRNTAVGGVLDAIGLPLAFHARGAVLASAVVAFPLMVRAIRLSVDAIDPGLEEAARTLGAAPLRVFATITLPLAAPGILAGAILAFARAFSEFGATITFVASIPGQTRTLPLALYGLTQVPGQEAAAARLCALSVAVAFATLLASEALARRVRASTRGE
jgi:molybdate transport system permease protein